MVARVNGVLGGVLAPESFTLSQSYYYGSVGGNPAHRAIVVDGMTTLDRCDQLDEIAIGKPSGSSNGHAQPGTNPEAEIGDIRATLEAIPNPIPSWDIKNGTWDPWNTIGMAVWRSSGGSQEGFEAFDQWSRKWPAKYDAEQTEFRWNHYFSSPPDKIGFGTLVHLARQARPDWKKPSEQAKQQDIVFDKRSAPSQANGAAVAVDDDDWEGWPVPAELLTDVAMPSFPIDFLPGALGDFVVDQATRMQAPPDYVGIAVVIAAATAIGKDFRMAPKANDNSWTERSCLWGGVIGDIGQKKSPSFNAALGPIFNLQAEFRAKHEEELEAYKNKARLAKQILKQWEKDCAAALKNGDDPPPQPEGIDAGERPAARQLLTNDTTQERLVGLMQQNLSGIMLFRDELSGWFSSFNQYRPGSDEQFFLQCHAGGPWNHNRKAGDIFVPDVYLNVLGGFQPEVISEALSRHRTGAGKAVDNGMAARLSLLVWPDPVKTQWIDRQVDAEIRLKVLRLFRDLLNFKPEAFVGPPLRDSSSQYPPFRFTPEGLAIFREWYVEHYRALEDIDPTDPLKGHFSKYDGLFARLAIVRHLICYVLDPSGLEPARVDDYTAIASRDFIDDYLRPHARKIYRRLGRGTAYHNARRIGQWIVENPDMTVFTARDVSRKEWSGLTGKDENTGRDHLRAALTYLDNVAGWVRSKEKPAGPSGGRPTLQYLVNPHVHRSFP
jgi:putative DNA primase/helicase